MDEHGPNYEKTPDYLLAPTLLPYLEASWHNSQHYDGSRMALYKLYFFFAAGTLAVNGLLPPPDPGHGSVAMISLALFVLLFGLLVQVVSVRYKERIVRDIRIIYRINDLLLNEPEEMKTVHAIYHLYRKAPGSAEERRIRARLSTTKLFLFTMALVSTGILLLVIWPVEVLSGEPTWGLVILSLFLHFAVYKFSKLGIAFNV